MRVPQRSMILASRPNQRAKEFFISAESLRANFSAVVHVIDYCTALSFELNLKSILAVRGVIAGEEVDKAHRHHDIIKFFKECNIVFENSKSSELVEYYNLILNGIGRYSTTTKGDRGKLDAALSGMYKEIPNYFNTPEKNCIYEINPESGIVDDSYKKIWNTLDNIFRTEYIAAQEGLTS